MFILIIPGVTINNSNIADKNHIFIIWFVKWYLLFLIIASYAPIKNNGIEYQFVSPHIKFSSWIIKIFKDVMKLFILLVIKFDEKIEQFPSNLFINNLGMVNPKIFISCKSNVFIKIIIIIGNATKAAIEIAINAFFNLIFLFTNKNISVMIEKIVTKKYDVPYA